MGEAKRRGSFEERKAAAAQRAELERAARRKEDIERATERRSRPTRGAPILPYLLLAGAYLPYVMPPRGGRDSG
jgi:hypothetical protein